MTHTVSIDINGVPFSMEAGHVAKQADGSVVVRHGGTMVLRHLRGGPKRS